MNYPYVGKMKDGRFLVETVIFTAYGRGFSVYKNPSYFKDLTLNKLEKNFSMGCFTFKKPLPVNPFQLELDF